MCAPKWQIGGLGGLFLIGIVVGCLTLTKLGDYYGRRPLYLVGLAMNFVLVLILMFSMWPWLTSLALFGLGLSITSRYYVGYTFTVEMNPKAQQAYVTTAVFICETLVYLIVCGYFVYISSYWRPLQYVNLGITALASVFVYFMPETPPFLVA